MGCCCVAGHCDGALLGTGKVVEVQLEEPRPVQDPWRREENEIRCHVFIRAAHVERV
jgi:hypothetical protein